MSLVPLYFHRTMEEYLQAFQTADLVLCRLYDVHMTEAMVAHYQHRTGTSRGTRSITASRLYSFSNSSNTVPKEQCQPSNHARDCSLVASFAEWCNLLQYEEKMLAGAACTSLGCTSTTRRPHAPFLQQADAACRVLF